MLKLGVSIVRAEHHEGVTREALRRSQAIFEHDKAEVSSLGAALRCLLWNQPRIAWRDDLRRTSNTEERMSDDDMRAELERLRKENEALKKGASKGISRKVSEKGGLSVYGLGRFPVTLYKEQWKKLLDMSDEIRNFIAANDADLKTKE